YNLREAERVVARQKYEQDQKAREEVESKRPANAVRPAKIETDELRRISLETVLHAHGLRFGTYNGEKVYTDHDKTFVIKVSNDVFSDRKDNMQGGKGAIDLVMHLQGV